VVAWAIASLGIAEPRPRLLSSDRQRCKRSYQNHVEEPHGQEGPRWYQRCGRCAVLSVSIEAMSGINTLYPEILYADPATVSSVRRAVVHGLHSLQDADPQRCALRAKPGDVVVEPHFGPA
jgi:hypothetical protein